MSASFAQSSKDLFERAQKVIPGGVNSPVRACRSVGADPVFVAAAKGGRIVSVEGKAYIDYVLSWGPMILGHGHPEVIQAVRQAIELGTSYGAPTPAEITLAEMIREAMPSCEMVRMVSSGTEATMSALRLARGFTGRAKLVKFEGCYHGHSDAFLASAGSGVATLSIPGTPGVPAEVVAHTLLAPYNDLAAVEDLFKRHGDDIAAIIVEPVAGNMGLVNPAPDFLQGLRDLTTKYGALLIFDEVITGFRMAYGGAQAAFGVTPDLTCLGKIIGGGFPVGCYGGRADVMRRIAPCGDVYQAGTLSGNPVAMAAGIATLEVLKRSDYAALAARTEQLAQGLKDVLEAKGQPMRLNIAGSLFTLFFTGTPVTNFETAKTMNTDLYGSFWRQMLAQGVYLAPSGYECAFLSFAHTEDDLRKTIDAAKAVEF